MCGQWVRSRKPHWKAKLGQPRETPNVSNQLHLVARARLTDCVRGSGDIFAGDGMRMWAATVQCADRANHTIRPLDRPSRTRTLVPGPCPPGSRRMRVGCRGLLWAAVGHRIADDSGERALHA